MIDPSEEGYSANGSKSCQKWQVVKRVKTIKIWTPATRVGGYDTRYSRWLLAAVPPSFCAAERASVGQKAGRREVALGWSGASSRQMDAHVRLELVGICANNLVEESATRSATGVTPRAWHERDVLGDGKEGGCSLPAHRPLL